MNVPRAIFAFAAAIGIAASVALPIAAAKYGGGSVQGYAADAPLSPGTIVELTGKNSDRVKAAAQSELQNMFGVVVDPRQVPLTLSSGDVENETFVAVSGTYDVLVSTQNGAIKSGDYITMSSVDGVAMKAGTSKEQSTVFGRAQKPFDGKGLTLGTATLKDTTGKTNRTVTLGSVPVTIDIRHNPNEKSTKADLPDFLQRLGQQIAEKKVSPIRIYISLGITAVSLITAIAVLYAGVRNSVISIGRNPMSKKSIFHALVEIILTAILILVIGLFAVYLLLKL